MKLSTKTRYGIRAMLEIAACYGQGPLQLKLVSERQDISIKYLEQLVAILKSAAMLHSVRGAKGGYVLAKPPEKIKLAEIVTALEGAINTVECVEKKDYCTRAADCATRQVWAKVQNAINEVLNGITLADLLQEAKKDRCAQDYQI